VWRTSPVLACFLALWRVFRRYILDPFGDVYSCPSTIGWKERRIGVYIPELSFNENYDKWKNRTIFAMEKCTKCELALVCGGDCGYALLLNENDLYTPVCTATEKQISRTIDYFY
jgi:radical SAM protein with 4Fe4S-binding SPASM domain